jgi:very-short-patch-repair endonuclease
MSSLSPSDIHRVDFVAFWNNKRFVICIDDSNHYATEEKYSNTLNETRMLMSEGWSVIRISNCEIENDTRLTQIIDSLPGIMNFLQR